MRAKAEVGRLLELMGSRPGKLIRSGAKFVTCLADRIGASLTSLAPDEVRPSEPVILRLILWFDQS
jgi:hypothetical protein